MGSTSSTNKDGWFEEEGRKEKCALHLSPTEKDEGHNTQYTGQGLNDS